MFDFPSSKDLKNKKVRLHFKENIELHEILLDKLAQKKEEEIGVSEKKFEVPLLKKTLQRLFIFALFLIFLLFVRTFQLQAIEGENFSARAEENKYILRQIQSERGIIYDRHFTQIAFNRSSFDLMLAKANLPKSEEEQEKVLKEVAQILKINLEDLKKKVFENENNQILIFENLDHQSLIVLETKIAELSGFQIVNNPIREYREGENFAHLIGYTNKIRAEEFKDNPEFYLISDYVGRDGVEKSYEEILRKNPGRLKIERDVRGNVISKEIIQYPESGKSLILWLDADLQKKARTELEKKYKEIGAKGGVVVAMDPKTGGILSLVSLPTFDNNLFQKGADQESLQALLQDPQKINPLFNRAISGKYLTGSTIKPLIAAAALEEKTINPEKQLYGSAYIEIPHRYDPEVTYKFRDWTVHGWVDVRKAIAQSCNIYFYTIGGGYGDQKGLGPTKIKEYLELFGWTAKTGIDLPGEAAGFVPDIDWKREKFGEGWWDGDTYNLSIGQGYIQITPLEMTVAFSAIANGGRLLQPQIINKIVDGSGTELKTLEEKEPKIIRQDFINPQNLKIVREGMRQAVTGVNSPQASAVILNSLPVSAAAKTGTAELGQDRFHNWVVVFAPYEEPEIVLTVMIENVKGVQAAALPVAKEILEWYFNSP